MTYNRTDISSIPWHALELPIAGFLPRWITVLAIAAHTFDILLHAAILPDVVTDLKLVCVIATEKLSYWKVFPVD